jgi:fatty acid desaturase
VVSAVLRYPEDLRTLSIVALYFSAFVALWVVDPLRTQPVWITLLAVGTTCWLSWLVATTTHNVIHCSIFKQRWLNKLFQVVLTVGYGHPVSSYVPGHNMSHHHNTQTAKDVMRTTKARFSWNLLNFFAFFPIVARDIVKGEAEFVSAMKARKPAWYRQLIAEGVVLAVVSIGLLVADWQAFILYFWLPHILAAFGIVTINLLQHDGTDDGSDWNHSRNFVGGWLNWWTCNNGYHTVHHMHPRMHWSLLPAYHAETVQPHIDPRLDRPSVVGYMWEQYVWPGVRTHYDGTPLELPAALRDQSWVPEVLPATASLGAED